MLALRWRTGHELRKAGGLQKLEEARKWIGPQSLWKGGRPADPFQTLPSGMIIKYSGVAFSH